MSTIQASVLRRVAANRSPDSYVAGATVLHRAENTPRYSADLDLFHDLEDAVARSAEADAATLRAAGYELSWLLRTPTFHRAVVGVDRQALKIEWAQDSAVRFYPVQADERFDYRLHDADAAVNKVLALAGRSEIRDFVDVLHLDDTHLPLGALAWAACGKDPGFTPEFLLEHAARHVAYTQDDLDRLSLREPLDLRDLKRRWLAALERARTLAASLPPDEVGCLYIGPGRQPVAPHPASDGFGSLIRHRGCVRGAWPSAGTGDGAASGRPRCYGPRRRPRARSRCPSGCGSRRARCPRSPRCSGSPRPWRCSRSRTRLRYGPRRRARAGPASAGGRARRW